MSRRTPGVVFSIWAGFCALVPAQHLRTERHAFARLMRLRSELLDAWLHAEPECRAACAESLASTTDADPFVATANALAALRGEPLSIHDRVRCGTVVLALPEVADGDQFRSVHVTVHAVRMLPAVLPPLAFDLCLLDAEDREIATATIDAETSPEQLSRYRATAELPFGEAADGDYRVAVRMRVGDGESRPLDEVRVVLDRTFPSRAERLPMLVDGTAPRVDAARALLAALPERRRNGLDRAILMACTLRVERPFSGEPMLPLADARADLRRAEDVLAAVRDDRDALLVLTGVSYLSVPIGPQAGRRGEFLDIAPLILDVDALSVSDAAASARPLLLVVPGVPSWTRDLHRPDSPQTLDPAWTYDALMRTGLARAASVDVVVMESPGRFASATGAVLDVVQQLRRLAPEREIVLLGEREGAYAASRAALTPGSGIERLLVLDGGAVTLAELEGQPSLRVGVLVSKGYPAASSLLQVAAAAAKTGRVQALEAANLPWCIAIPAATEPITHWLRETAR